MSQFDPHGQQPGAYMDPHAAYAEPPRTSGLAIGALVLGLLGIIPCLGLLTAPIGILLGLIGVIAIKAPMQKGRGMAVAGIVLGLLFTAGQGYGIMKLVGWFQPMIAMVNNGPQSQLADGFAGDIGSFRASFDGDGATLSDAEALAFIDELRSRYGEFNSSALDQAGGQGSQPPFGQQNFSMPYILQFDNATVSADVEIRIIEAPGQSPPFAGKLGYILITDPDRGDLRYPPLPGAETDDADTDTSADDANAADSTTDDGP